MPKLKTNRGAAKRFKKTSTGKFKRSSANKNHILRASSIISDGDVKSIKKLLPYS